MIQTIAKENYKKQRKIIKEEDFMIWTFMVSKNSLDYIITRQHKEKLAEAKYE